MAPFGGYKRSGNGREYGLHGFEEYLEIKAMSALAKTRYRAYSSERPVPSRSCG